MRKNLFLIVFAIAGLFSFSACDKDSLYEHPEKLQGDFEVLYFVEHVEDSIVVHQDPEPDYPIRIRFGLNGMVSDTALVRYRSHARPNELWGDLKVFGDNSFKISEAYSTRALSTSWENLFLNALQKSETFTVEDDRLLIMYGKPQNMVVLAPVKNKEVN